MQKEAVIKPLCGFKLRGHGGVWVWYVGQIARRVVEERSARRVMLGACKVSESVAEDRLTRMPYALGCNTSA